MAVLGELGGNGAPTQPCCSFVPVASHGIATKMSPRENECGGSVDIIINTIYISFSFQFLVNRIGAS